VAVRMRARAVVVEQPVAVAEMDLDRDAIGHYGATSLRANSRSRI
jgi:hypothetical protein